MSPAAVRVAGLDDLTDGEPTRIDIDGRTLAVVRLGEQVYVIGDRCSHADVSLSEGEVDADACTIECPKHGSEFDLRTGEPLSLPAVRPVPRYQVAVVDGDVLVELSEEST
ncbi:MAG: non-heme iron oxygenase ferredoxin subunit [Microthrixaceae bacterium]